MLIVSHSSHLVGNSLSICFSFMLRLLLGNVPQNSPVNTCVVPNEMLRCEMSVTEQHCDEIAWNILSQSSWTTAVNVSPNIF